MSYIDQRLAAMRAEHNADPERCRYCAGDPAPEARAWQVSWFEDGRRVSTWSAYTLAEASALVAGADRVGLVELIDRAPWPPPAAETMVTRCLFWLERDAVGVSEQTTRTVDGIYR